MKRKDAAASQGPGGLHTQLGGIASLDDERMLGMKEEGGEGDGART